MWLLILFCSYVVLGLIEAAYLAYMHRVHMKDHYGFEEEYNPEELTAFLKYSKKIHGGGTTEEKPHRLGLVYEYYSRFRCGT